jgi:hypothetical protein
MHAYLAIQFHNPVLSVGVLRFEFAPTIFDTTCTVARTLLQSGEVAVNTLA